MLSCSCLLSPANELADVWLRRVQTAADGRSFIDLLPLRDGDVAVLSGEQGMSFFSARKLTRDEAERHAVVTTNIQPYQAVLPDGRVMRRVGPPGCVLRPEVTIALEDAQRKALKEYALLWIPEKPRRLTAAECALIDAPPSTLQRVLILDPKLLALPDSTLLAADPQSGVVVRFDRDFSSQTDMLGDRLLLMPAHEFKDLIKAHAQPGRFDWQGFQSALEAWVTAHRQIGKQR